MTTTATRICKNCGKSWSTDNIIAALKSWRVESAELAMRGVTPQSIPFTIRVTNEGQDYVDRCPACEKTA